MEARCLERLQTLVYIEAVFAFIMALVYSIFLGQTEFGLWLNGFGWILGLVIGVAMIFHMGYTDAARFVLSIGAILGTAITFIAGFYIRSIVFWVLTIINFEASGLVTLIIMIVSAFVGILIGIVVGVIASDGVRKIASFLATKLNFRSQRWIITFTVIWMIAIVGISGVFINPSSPMAINIGRQGVSMVDLQMDYTMGGEAVGNFKSYNPGDTILFRDKIMRIEETTDINTGQAFTRLYFVAHPVPYRVQLERGIVEKESWYYYTWDGSHEEWRTIFPVVDQGSPWAVLVVKEEQTRFHVGDTVEIDLHVVERMPLITEYDTEIINEFWLVRARPFEKEEVRIVR
jgi:hypothetical protein